MIPVNDDAAGENLLSNAIGRRSYLFAGEQITVNMRFVIVK